QQSRYDSLWLVPPEDGLLWFPGRAGRGREQTDIGGGAAPGRPRAKQAEPLILIQRRQGEVLADRHPAEHRVEPAFSRDVGDVVVGCVGRGADDDVPAVDVTDDLSLGRDPAAQGLQERVAAMAFEPRYADALSGPE